MSRGLEQLLKEVISHTSIVNQVKKRTCDAEAFKGIPILYAFILMLLR